MSGIVIHVETGTLACKGVAVEHPTSPYVMQNSVSVTINVTSKRKNVTLQAGVASLLQKGYVPESVKAIYDAVSFSVWCRTGALCSFFIFGGCATPVPPGYTGYCIRHPERVECGGLKLNFPNNWKEMLDHVNAAVNKLPYKSDLEQYGEIEYWESIDDHGAGDCEDYAIAKLRRLYALGYPIAALRLATLRMPYGVNSDSGNHAVLISETPKGGWVLGNNMPVMRLDMFLSRGFKPLMIQETGGKPTWVDWVV